MRFFVLLSCPLLAVSSLTAQTLTADNFFDDTVLHEIRLTMNPADFQRLKATFRDNTYYPCIFRWRGITVENVGVRSSGAGTRSPIKPAYRVDFDRYEESQDFLGLKSFKLDNLNQDPSGLRERLTMGLFRRFGLPASREAHTRLYINNEYVGAYGVVEAVDKRFLSVRYSENDGYLYEYNYAFPWKFEYLGSDPARYSPIAFDPVTHERDPDPRPIEAMVRTINQASDADFPRAAAEYIDLRLFLTHVALETYMAEVDGILGDLGMANFYFYRFERKNLSQFIVWDKDNTFSSSTRPILRNVDDNVLMRRALAVAGNRQFFLEALVRASSVAGGSGGWMDQELQREYEQIRAAVREDPNKQCPLAPFQPGTALKSCTNEEFEAEILRMRQFIRERPDFVTSAAFAAGYQPSGSAPRLSEGGAVNAASSTPLLTAGSLASLYGERLSTTTTQATSLPLPTSLGGASVLINGITAPLLFVSPGQINLQVPWDVGAGSASVAAVADGAPSNTVSASVASASPGVFVTGSGSAVAVHFPDNALVSSTRPAGAGDVLIVYATGLGAVDQTVQTGRAAPAEPLARARDTVTVRIGGVQAEPFFAGLSPGFVGLFQLNIRVPSGVPAGSATPLTITVGSQTSAPAPIATR